MFERLQWTFSQCLCCASSGPFNPRNLFPAALAHFLVLRHWWITLFSLFTTFSLPFWTLWVEPLILPVLFCFPRTLSFCYTFQEMFFPNYFYHVLNGFSPVSCFKFLDPLCYFQNVSFYRRKHCFMDVISFSLSQYCDYAIWNFYSVPCTIFF